MRMRLGGQVRTFAFGAMFAAAIVAPAVAACDDSTGCEDSLKGIMAGQAATAASAAEAAQVASEKPLPLIERKSRKKVSTRKAAPARAADPAAVPDETVKNARAQAPAAEPAKSSGQDGNLTELDRSPSPAQASMPVVSPDEVNEIDEAAAAEATPTSVMQQTPAMSAEKQAGIVDDKPRLSAARIELPESTVTVASAASEDSAWDKSSLIGKIFIALGGLLTAASAVRMFIG